MAEAGLRIAGYDLDRSELRRFHPRLGWTLEPSLRAADQVNELGFRFPATTLAKPHGVRRLVVLGDSFTEAIGLPWKATFPGSLAGWLDPAAGDGPRWEVIVLASGGWGTVQQLLALREVGLGYEPDLVVIAVFPFNDLCNNSRALAYTCSVLDNHRPYLANGWRFHLRAASRLFGLADDLFWSRRGFAPGTQAAAGAYRIERAREVGLPPGFSGALASLLPPDEQPPAVRRAWSDTRTALAELAATARGEGIPLFAVVIPFARSFGPFWDEFSDGRYRRAESGHDCRAMEGILTDLGVPFAPCRRFGAGPMRPEDHFSLPSDPHLNRLGHHVVAGWILRRMRRLGLTEAAPPAPRPGRVDVVAWENPGTVGLNGFEDDWRSAHGSPLVELEERRAVNALGPKAVLSFQAAAGRQVELGLRFTSLVSANSVRVLINGGEAAVYPALHLGAARQAVLTAPTVAGRNEVRFVFGNWRHREAPGTRLRGSPSVRFDRLLVALEPAAGRPREERPEPASRP